jgi:hypothetical protein
VATAETPPAAGRPAGATPRRSDRSPWNWLLIVPIVVPLLVPLYNHDQPRLGGWPVFYWLQLLFVFLGVAVTSVVYLATRRSPQEREAARRAAAGHAQDTTSARDGGEQR